jgi:hypothetical protein
MEDTTVSSPKSVEYNDGVSPEFKLGKLGVRFVKGVVFKYFLLLRS